jgi:hypothetical protein
VVRVAAHAHRDELDEHRTVAGTSAVSSPGKRRGHRIGIRAVDRDSGHAVAGCLVGKHPNGRLLRHGSRECRLVVLDAEDDGQLARRAHVDGLVPLAE